MVDANVKSNLDFSNFPHYAENERCVTVVRDKTVKTSLQNFRCINCGKLIFQYRNPMKMIFDGRVWESNEPLEISCYNCKVKYIVD